MLAFILKRKEFKAKGWLSIVIYVERLTKHVKGKIFLFYFSPVRFSYSFHDNHQLYSLFIQTISVY